MEDGDPFGSIVDRCRATPSQEEKLQWCPFARESESFPEDESSPSPTPVEPTGIVMVSLSDSSKEEEEEFHTPPDQPPSVVSSHESETDAAVVVGEDRPDGGEIERGGYCEGGTDAAKVVDLGRDSDNLGFSEEPNLVVECRSGEVKLGESRKFRVLEGESSAKRQRVSEETLVDSVVSTVSIGDTEPMVVDTDETNPNYNGHTEVLEASEFEEICAGMGNWLTEHTVNVNMVNMPVKETEGGVRVCKNDGVHKMGEAGLVSKNVEDLEKFKYVACGEVDGCSKERGKRELPISLRTQEKNLGSGLVSECSSGNNRILNGILDALKLVADEVVDDSSEDIDFLETAKRNGLVLPRPRWWPPNGFND